MVTLFVHTQTLLKRKYINSLGSVTLTDQPSIGVGLRFVQGCYLKFESYILTRC